MIPTYDINLGTISETDEIKKYIEMSKSAEEALKIRRN